jgi:hypothetical protein
MDSAARNSGREWFVIKIIPGENLLEFITESVCKVNFKSGGVSTI